jgi:hypothetical protein
LSILLYCLLTSILVAGIVSSRLEARDMPFGIAGLQIDQPGQLELVQSTGAASVLVTVPWEALESAPGRIDWAMFETFLNQAEFHALNVYLLPQSGVRTSLMYADPAPAFRAFLEALVIRGRGRVAGYVMDVSSLPHEAGTSIEMFASGLAEDLKRWDPAAQRVLYPREAMMSTGGWSAVLSTISESDVPLRIGRSSGGGPAQWALVMGSQDDMENAPVIGSGVNMREVAQLPVRALAAGLDRVFWGQLVDKGREQNGLYREDGISRKASWFSFRHMIKRVFPFTGWKSLRDGQELWSVRFNQPEGRTTTVVWAAKDGQTHTWPLDTTGKFRIWDVGGTIAGSTSPLPVRADPYYIVREGTTPQTADINITEGFDWWLPPEVQTESYAGYFNFNPKPTENVRVIGWHPRWKDWHVGPGEYDFSSFEEKLTDAKKHGYRIGIRLQSVVRNTVPDWIVEKYNPSVVTIPGRLRLQVVAPWHPDVRREFEAFIREFGRRGYHKDDAFVFASIHGISHSYGEEFSLPNESLRFLEREAALTPQAMRDWIQGRLQAWSDAFGDQAYKLGWVGRATAFGLADYTKIAADAVEYAVSHGMGSRSGFVEMYHYLWYEPSVAQSRSPDGYLLTDENFPVTRENRYFADENEEYVWIKRWRFGILEGDAYRYRMSMLRALQMRRNFIATNEISMDLDRDLTEYVRLSLGKNIANTPDAWCYLREGYVRDRESGGPLPLKNFERWLNQRDVPGGQTQAVVRYDRDWSMTTDPPGIQHEFTARRTDCQSGNNRIYFDIDDRFPDDESYVLKVTYLDDTRGHWMVSYENSLGTFTETTAVHGVGDGTIKTATFHLRNTRFNNGLLHKQDFCITNDGVSDVTVLLVRLIRNYPD